MLTQRFLISAIVAACGAIPASATLTTYCSNVGPGCGDPSASSDFTSATSSDTFSDISVAQGGLGNSYTYESGPMFSDPLGLLERRTRRAGRRGTAVASNAGVSTMTTTLPTSVNAIEFYVGMKDFSTLLPDLRYRQQRRNILKRVFRAD